MYMCLLHCSFLFVFFSVVFSLFALHSTDYGEKDVKKDE